MDEEQIRLPGLVSPLRWETPPLRWTLTGGAARPVGAGASGGAPRTLSAGSILSVTTGPRTDLFVDPGGASPTTNAPRLLALADESFRLSARVEVDFSSGFDAGVLLVWSDEATWAKLCFERSPQGQPMVVSVVTRAISDDANSFDVHGTAVWLRISRRGRAEYAFHASTDGTLWRFVRHFALPCVDDAPVRVGVEVQAPTGEQCTARFSDLHYDLTPLAELRNGG